MTPVCSWYETTRQLLSEVHHAHVLDLALLERHRPQMGQLQNRGLKPAPNICENLGMRNRV